MSSAKEEKPCLPLAFEVPLLCSSCPTQLSLTNFSELLEDDGVVKVLHDCRQDALFLSRSSVDLKPVIDTQIAFAFVTRLRTSRTPLPCGLNTVLRVFAQGSENQYKERARALMEANKEIWSIRPLDEILLGSPLSSLDFILPRISNVFLTPL